MDISRHIPAALAQQLVEFLRQHAGTAWTAEAVSAQLGYTPQQVETALETLALSGLIEREYSLGGRVSFLLHQPAS